jgi:hypothetical protein
MEETIDYKARYQALLKDINPDCLDDAITLANSRVNDEKNLEQALDEITEKYPHFKKQAQILSTGIKTGSHAPAVSGVEAAFLKKNPGIKL